MRTVDHYFYPSPDLPLYHYTGIGTLLGLANSRELWASHIYYLNDANELVEADEAMQYVGLPDFVFGDTGGKSEFLDQFRHWVKYCREVPVNLFIFSLSEKQSLLSQWRSYTPHGKGVSVGFSTALVRRIAEDNGLRIAKCVYKRDLQAVLLESLIEKLWTSWEQQRVAYVTDTKFTMFFESHRNGILQVLALIKHEAFEEECEWRLISNTDISDDQICYRQGDGAALLTPFIKLKLPNDPKLFDLVTLGPTPHKDLALSALNRFLLNNNLSANSCACDIPFRKW